MALFSSAADTFVFSFLIRRFLFREGRSTTEMLPAKEAWRISLGKVYSPECVEGEFSEVELRFSRFLRTSPSRRSEKSAWPRVGRDGPQVELPRVLRLLARAGSLWDGPWRHATISSSYLRNHPGS